MGDLRAKAAEGVEARFAFAVRSQGAAKVEEAEALVIHVYDVIGEWWGEGVSARDVLGQLKSAKKATSITVRINSSGGDAWDGIAIYNLLHQNPARVVVEVDGIAASAASVIAMAGDEIRMAENALMMIHNAWTVMVGESSELRAKADDLDKLNEAIANTYIARTGRSRDEVVQMMNDETWFTAEEAKDLGFATAVTPAKKAAAMLRSDLDIARFKRAPDAVLDIARRPVVQERATEPAPSVQAEPTPPAPPEPKAQPKDKHMTTLDVTIARALGLPVGASESDAIAAASRLRELEVGVMAVTGVTASAEALGAVRGLKASADEAQKLREENGQLRAERDKQNFETQIERGRAERKLNEPLIQMYRDEFERASAEGRGHEVVSRLKGHVDVGPRLMAEPYRQPSTSAAGTTPAPLVHNGKSFNDMQPLERARLSQDNPELYRAMRDDWRQSQGLDS